MSSPSFGYSLPAFFLIAEHGMIIVYCGWKAKPMSLNVADGILIPKIEVALRMRTKKILTTGKSKKID